MKAIVANVLFGSVFGCLSYPYAVNAAPVAVASPANPRNLRSAQPSVRGTSFPKRSYPYKAIDRLAPIKTHSVEPALTSSLPQGKTYTYQTEATNLVLGFQNTFWSDRNKGKYWGVTTVENWGDDPNPATNASRPNYINAAPILAAGNSQLTFSGGGSNSLSAPVELDEALRDTEFERFRGGITYHRGIANRLTMGVGFVYEDLLTGFTQLTYDSGLLPLKTTLSVLTKESSTSLHSYVRFQPSQNLTFDYRSAAAEHRLDLDWRVAPALAIVAKGNSQQKSYSTGVKVNLHSSFMALSATATLDNERNLEWQFSSRIGSFQFAHSTQKTKANSELATSSWDSQMGFKCSGFIRYQTESIPKGDREFMTWGGQLQSATKIDRHTHLWSLNLGYGTGNYGKGLIAEGAIALQPDLVLRLDYQAVSAVSDESKIKFQLSSK